jgi:hypothetical protein
MGDLRYRRTTLSGLHTRTPVVLMQPHGSNHKAYQMCVEHNTAGL